MQHAHTEITFADAERAVLERVCEHQGLDTVEQAAEWLAKRRLRRATQVIDGRGRMLLLVRSDGK